ncbi:MAG TPA: ATP-binding cassette domain-containing protein [Gammaproteobacteria bacterium]|nr:ATP-binding cassette domain-containing protein [Gammaproteobacteria bacterium]
MNVTQWFTAVTDPVEIEIRDLHKSFGSNDVLRGINLSLFRGEITAIVGGSGCGKTVLLNTILGQYSADSGSIKVLDRTGDEPVLKGLSDFGELEIDDIHRHWGVVFQRNALFSGSVFFNIALWLREIKGMDDEAIKPIAVNALKEVGLPESRDFLERNSNELSGGMAKRLAIARAIAMDPYVMFYDEPTTGLDPTSSANIHNLIFKIHNAGTNGQGGKTSIIITHDKDLLIRLRPRTVMLHEGKVYFDGPFEEFEASESEVIRPYFDLMPVLQGRFRESESIDPDLTGRKGLIV